MRSSAPQLYHKAHHNDALRLIRRSGVYHYRRRDPFGSSREIVMSLGTRLFRRAEWLSDRLERHVRELISHHAMTIEDIRRILREYLADLLASDTAARVSAEPGLPVYASWVPGMEDHDHPDDADASEARDNIEHWRAARRSRDYGSVSEEVEELAAKHSVPDNMRSTLALGILEAFIKFNEVAQDRASGEAFTVLDVEPGPEVPQGLSIPGRTEVAAKAPPFSELIEPFFVHRETVAKATHQVMGQERGTLRRFLEATGDRPVNEYGRGDITRFLGTLRRLPKTYGKSPEGKERSLVDILAQADADGADRISDKTVKRHLSVLSQFFKFAMDQGHISNAHRTELVRDHAFKGAKKARDQRDAWTSEELVKLFQSPVWTGSHPVQRAKPGPEIIRDAKFWLPLLALHHGARLEEFADLRRKDVIRDDEAGGIWAFDLNEEARRLKTENAIRIVPMHPEIIRLGFLGYVTRIAPNPDDPLFPDLEPQGKDKRRGARFTRDFRYYREAVGVYREGVGMHAFRHTAITRLTDAIEGFQQKRHRDYMMGHAAGDGEGDIRYDKGPGLKACAETLALLRYPELDLSHLYVTTEPSSASHTSEDR